MDDSTGPLPDDWCEHRFDHLAPELAATMPETMGRMRELCPVARSSEHGGYFVVSSYETALAVAQNWKVYSSAHGLSILNSPSVVRNLPVEVDPPEQRVYKRLITPFFTPAAVAVHEDRTRDLINRLVDDVVEAGACDFMDAIARPLPSLAFFEFILDAPAEDIDRVAELASRASTPNHPAAGECWQGLYQWIQEYIALRRRQSSSRQSSGTPRPGDVIDAILHAEIDGRPITDEEIIGTVQLLILGGLETTAGALGLMFARFCAQPGIPDRLRAHPEQIPRAVEELLRLEPPFVSVGRTVVEDGELGPHPVRSGDKVLIHWASANRDAAEFPDPDVFDIDRERNRHFSFGAGPHRCAGSNLARLNLRIALEVVLDRLRDIRLAEGTQLRYHAGLTRSPLELPISFTPGPRVGAATG
jgi:cytochrome P450